VLPLNVVYCKKLLIVLTDSYLERLWCLWELFAVFIFCRKEVGIERIDILALDSNADLDFATQQIRGLQTLGGQLELFDLNCAHCFSPNEEFKIRQIMYCIGVERLTELQSAIQKVVCNKIKQLKRWVLFANVFSQLRRMIGYHHTTTATTTTTTTTTSSTATAGSASNIDTLQQKVQQQNTTTSTITTTTTTTTKQHVLPLSIITPASDDVV
jgi:hypothetical protein